VVFPGKIAGVIIILSRKNQKKTFENGGNIWNIHKTLQVPNVVVSLFLSKETPTPPKQPVAAKRPLSVVEVVRFQHDGSCSKTTKPGLWP